MRLFPKEVEKRRKIARAVGAAYRALPGVCGIFAWGSTASGQADSQSDVDIGIYTESDVPDRHARLPAVKAVADAQPAIQQARFGRLEAVDKFSVQGVPVFVAWWRIQDEEDFIRTRLARLPDCLGDREAENELGEIQRGLVLWDPKGVVENLRTMIQQGLVRLRTELIGERLSRARYDIEENLPRALRADDLVWAEESKANAANEIIRVVYYLNGRFLRRLKGVEAEVEQFHIMPPAFSDRLRGIAAATATEARSGLAGLFRDVLALARASCQGMTQAE